MTSFLTVQPERIPSALATEDRWMLWRRVWSERDGKQGRWVKLPCQTNGDPAKPNDRSTWTAFEAVLARYQRGGFEGLGFCLGDGWAGIDLDDTDSVPPRITCYVERRPSGTGFKAFGRSHRIGGEIKSGAFTTWTGPRFFTVTGHGSGDPTVAITDLLDEWFPLRASGAGVRGPRPSFVRAGDVRGTENIECFTDEQVVERVMATPQAEKFLRLVRGDMSEYGNDHSRADQALVSILAFWCQGDLVQVDRLFRQSKLMRDKWNSASYRRATLLKAVR